MEMSTSGQQPRRGGLHFSTGTRDMDSRSTDPRSTDRAEVCIPQGSWSSRSEYVATSCGRQVEYGVDLLYSESEVGQVFDETSNYATI